MHLLVKAFKLDHIHLTDVDGYIEIDHCRAVQYMDMHTTCINIDPNNSY